MADRQTALAVFDFLDSLRAGQYRIGADAEKDHATAGLLASLSGDTGPPVGDGNTHSLLPVFLLCCIRTLIASVDRGRVR